MESDFVLFGIPIHVGVGVYIGGLYHTLLGFIILYGACRKRDLCAVCAMFFPLFLLEAPIHEMGHAAMLFAHHVGVSSISFGRDATTFPGPSYEQLDLGAIASVIIAGPIASALYALGCYGMAQTIPRNPLRAALRLSAAWAFFYAITNALPFLKTDGSKLIYFSARSLFGTEGAVDMTIIVGSMMLTFPILVGIYLGKKWGHVATWDVPFEMKRRIAQYILR